MKQLAIVFITLLGLSLSGIAAASSFTFKASASGEQEVPPVMTETSGSVLIRFDRALRDVDYVLTIRRGVGITQAHLHCGAAGANGPVVACLFPLSAGGVDVNGRLAKGTLTNDGLTPGDCGGINVSNIASLFAAMREGLIYLNVHSMANPGGEIRAQWYPK